MKKTIFILALLLIGLFSVTNVNALAGDFNNDGKVDFEDFFLFAWEYGQREGNINYNAKYDLNSNGVVDMADFNLFVSISSFASKPAMQQGVKNEGEYRYDLNKVMVVNYPARVDAHVVLRNLGKESNVDVKVYLLDGKGNVVSRAVDSDVRLSLKEVHREIFTLEKPGKGVYTLIVEADNNRMNGYNKKAVRVNVQ